MEFRDGRSLSADPESVHLVRLGFCNGERFLVLAIQRGAWDLAPLLVALDVLPDDWNAATQIKRDWRTWLRGEA